jgi:hypothetical protein
MAAKAKVVKMQTGSWYDRNPPMSEKEIAQRNKEQYEIDNRVSDLKRYLTLEPCRSLSQEEIQSIQHTITHVSNIPFSRSTGEQTYI